MQPAAATLVIGPSWVGDAVMAQCLLESLQRQTPGTPIDVLAPRSVHPVLERMPQVRSVLAAPFAHGDVALRARLALGASLRGRYLQAYVLPGSWKAALVPWAARVPTRCGYLREWRYGLLNDIRVLPEAQRRRTAMSFQALADPAVLSDASRLHQPRLTVVADGRRHLLDRWQLEPGAYVVMAPGAEYGAAKRWPVRHWIALCAHALQKNLRPVLLGSERDQLVTADIASGATGTLDLAGRTRLGEAIDILSACRAAVTNDSGLMHVAAAVAAPVVAIYGSTSPRDTPPLSPTARVLTSALPCSPCHERSCPLAHHACMEELMPARVIESLAL
jgi:heptosyltransferase-2